jgi:hypothetical protein
MFPEGSWFFFAVSAAQLAGLFTAIFPPLLADFCQKLNIGPSAARLCLSPWFENITLFSRRRFFEPSHSIIHRQKFAVPYDK